MYNKTQYLQEQQLISKVKKLETVTKIVVKSLIFENSIIFYLNRKLNSIISTW